MAQATPPTNGPVAVMDHELKTLCDALEHRRSVDLFAGCGGLSLGLHEAGWEGVFAIEKDPMAFETLFSNLVADGAPYNAFPKWPSWLPTAAMTVEDLLAEGLREELAAMRGEVALVAGGPPCQGFSVGGRRNGADSRNTLVHDLLDVVEILQPAFVLIENVEGIARRFVSKPGASATSTADNVVTVLGEMGYEAEINVVDASRFGVPQTRRRVLIFGVHRSLVRSGEPHSLTEALEEVRGAHLASLGLPLDRPVTASEAIGDLDGKKRVICPDSPKFLSGTYTTARSSYARLMRRGVASSSVPDSHRFSVHGDAIKEMYRLALETQPPGRLSKAFMVSCGTKKEKKFVVDPSAPASTITTHPDEFIHFREPRNVTVREMARFQSFPDDFHFKGRYTINGPRRRFDVARCSQVGNAVPPLLAAAIGRALATIADRLVAQ